MGGAVYDIDRRLTEYDAKIIDRNYLEERYRKYIKVLPLGEEEQESIDAALSELHNTFATLSQNEQRYATRFLNDVQSGEVIVEENKTFMDYVSEYQKADEDEKTSFLVEAFGIDPDLLKVYEGMVVTESNINEYNRFNNLKDSVDKNKAKLFFERLEKESLSAFTINIKTEKVLRDYLLGDSSIIESYIDGNQGNDG